MVKSEAYSQSLKPKALYITSQRSMIKMMQYNRTGLDKVKSRKDEIRIRNLRYADLIKLTFVVLVFVVFVLTIAK